MENSVEILQRQADHRAAALHENPADFDEHVRFYRSVLRVVRNFLVFMILLLIGLYAFLVR